MIYMSLNKSYNLCVVNVIVNEDVMPVKGVSSECRQLGGSLCDLRDVALDTDGVFLSDA
jgi:hypothetical protein